MSLLNFFEEKGSSRKRKQPEDAGKADSSSASGTKRRKKAGGPEGGEGPGPAEAEAEADEASAGGRGGGYVSSDSDEEVAGKENRPATSRKRKRKTAKSAEDADCAGDAGKMEAEAEAKQKDKGGESAGGAGEGEGEGEEEPPAADVTYATCQTLLEKSWAQLLKNEFRKSYFKSLQKALAKEEKSGATIYPPVHQVFRAFELCPWERLKVVILGQDPYHDVGQAEGLCFSVPEGVKVPSSLRNIFKEAKTDVGLETPGHGSLVRWGEQGVLLLNAALTVRAHKANSHARLGWQEFTDAVIQLISRKHSGVVFVLWGKHAQKKKTMIDRSKHRFIESPHPSGLSAHRGFFGSQPFSKTNEALKKLGKEPVDWNIPA